MLHECLREDLFEGRGGCAAAGLSMPLKMSVLTSELSSK